MLGWVCLLVGVGLLFEFFDLLTVVCMVMDLFVACFSYLIDFGDV